MRVSRYAARIAATDDHRAFYARSFAADSHGTAEALLTWRDSLVEAGWDGGEVPAGGERLAALARLEAGIADRVPAGEADRLAAAHRALSVEPAKLYDALTLVEHRSLWPGRWRSIFDAIEETGTSLATFRRQLGGAPPHTDLGRVQELLRGDAAPDTSDLPAGLRGDGSLLVLRGDTAAELAAITASLLATSGSGALVVRSGDAAPLEGALRAHGSSGQGLTSSSAWRPAMQILPLTFELAFEPRDPRRALELLTLKEGPFRGSLGRHLAKAVTRSPGIGGREWQQRKREARERIYAREVDRRASAGASEVDAALAASEYLEPRMQLVADWIERRGADPVGAPAALLGDLATRVHAWLLARVAEAPEIYGPALVQAKALVDALAHDPREVLSREAVRQLVDAVVRAPHDHERAVERAGRVPHVPHPSAVLAPCTTLLMWNFVGGTERRPRSLPWTGAERSALLRSGVRLQDPSRLVVEEMQAWRWALLAAGERAIMVVPASIGGAVTAPHPMWDEIAARLRLDAAAEARLTHHARDVRTGATPLVPITLLDPLALPDAPAIWNVPADLLGLKAASVSSATSLETLVSCPLRWVLEERAGLASGAVAKIAADELLCGNLGHRLVEELFADGAFDREDSAFALRAEVILGELIRLEGATLLLEGMGFERTQLAAQLVRAVRELRRYLCSADLRIVAVEEEMRTDSPAGTLRGRIDVRLADAKGRAAVLDLKWGESRYRAAVREGRAIQLAAYARGLRGTADGSLPPAAYFALRSGRVVTADARMHAETTLDGVTLDETWSRVERTAQSVVASLSRGAIPVSGVRRSLPLLEALGGEATDRSGHFVARPDAACPYCSCASICGRAWEGSR